MTAVLLTVLAIVVAVLVLSGRRLAAAFREMVEEDPYSSPVELPPLPRRELRDLRSRYGLDEWTGRD